MQKGAASPVDSTLWPNLKAVKDNHTVEVDYEAWYTNASLLSATTIRDGLRQHILG